MTIENTPVRWGDGRRADSDFAREQILDAAMRCYLKNTVQKTRMEHIAREAKVSRTTVYRYFESRDDVVIGLMFRELHRFLDGIGSDVFGAQTFGEFIVETLAVANEQVPQSPMLLLILQETSVLMKRVYANSTDIFLAASNHFRPRFDAALAAGELHPGITFEAFTDWVMHIGSAYMMLPSKWNEPERFRQLLWQMLVPAIVRDEFIPEQWRRR